MSEKSKHTPNKIKHYEGKLKADNGVLLDEKGLVVLVPDFDTLEIDEATCPELARRWNSHQELVEALEELVALSDRKHNAWDKARAVIAKAKGAQ